MGRALTAELMFLTPEAAEFRSRVLAGCHVLDAEELHALADELHTQARSQRADELGLREYDVSRRQSVWRGYLADERA